MTLYMDYVAAQGFPIEFGASGAGTVRAGGGQSMASCLTRSPDQPSRPSSLKGVSRDMVFGRWRDLRCPERRRQWWYVAMDFQDCQRLNREASTLAQVHGCLSMSLAYLSLKKG